MNNPHFARLAARALKRSGEDDGAADVPSAGARTEAVAALERALVERRRRLARRRAGYIGASVVLAAAAVLGLAILVSLGDPHALGAAGPRQYQPPAAAVRGAQESPAVERASDRVEVIATETGGGSTVLGEHVRGGRLAHTSLPAGSRIITPAGGSALLALSTGTRLTVASRSDFSVVGDGAVEVFRLDRGALSAEVAKLEAGQRFLIDTPDAEVEVHGTVFDVLVGEPSEACGGGRTRVVVTEGVVTVRRGTDIVYVRTGEHWPRECAPTHLAARHVDGADVRAHELPGSAIPAPSIPSTVLGPQAIAAPGPEVGSRLAAMNDAFASAVALRQRGEVDLAIHAFTRFADDYRDGPLEESARVELLRLLVRTDRNLARAHAAHYLTDYPDGFARQEAARVLE